MSNSCSVIGNNQAPVEIKIWEATAQDQHGKLLWEGTLNENEPQGPWDTANGRIVYQYRTLPDGTWSGDVFSSCIDGNQVSVPV